MKNRIIRGQLQESPTGQEQLGPTSRFTMRSFRGIVLDFVGT